MIVSPRRLILAITLVPPVIKIKQQGGSVQFLTFMSHIHYMRIKNLDHFFIRIKFLLGSCTPLPRARSPRWSRPGAATAAPGGLVPTLEVEQG